MGQLKSSCILSKTNQSLFNTIDSLSAMYNYFHQHKVFYLMLLEKRGAQSFREQLVKMVVEGENWYLGDGSRSVLKTQFLANALVGVIEWWLIHEFPLSTEEMAQYTYEMINHQLKST
nr:TetR-like C-terminal domain-containing protein [Geomicrobium sp. JCM 19037]